MWEQFVQERVYLKGISPATIRYYKNVQSAFQPILAEPTQAALLQQIIVLRERGVSPISVNCRLRGIKAYMLWRKEQGQQIFKVQFLKTEQKILTTLSADGIASLIKFRPCGTNQTRAHLIALIILDCGLRISETLGLRKEDINLENLTLLVMGKGGKHRLVPISKELRTRLFRYVTHHEQGYLFQTRSGPKMTVRNIERDFKTVLEKAGVKGIRASPHTIRHSFAVCYLRNGGNIEFLRRLLGHSSLLTTQKYLRSLGVEDLGAVHNSLSPLSARR